ncbi:MAG: hypothetical protein U5R31_13705 [Acidimicrobiia bacterium]|nr:hypothetical protein [Acidimicrobiia bacterium]
MNGSQLRESSETKEAEVGHLDLTLNLDRIVDQHGHRHTDLADIFDKLLGRLLQKRDMATEVGVGKVLPVSAEGADDCDDAYFVTAGCVPATMVAGRAS